MVDELEAHAQGQDCQPPGPAFYRDLEAVLELGVHREKVTVQEGRREEEDAKGLVGGEPPKRVLPQVLSAIVEVLSDEGKAGPGEEPLQDVVENPKGVAIGPKANKNAQREEAAGRKKEAVMKYNYRNEIKADKTPYK